MNVEGFSILARAATPEETLLFGWLCLLLGLGGLGMSLLKWNWFQKHCAWLTRWRYFPWSIPASKLGMSFGCITAILVGIWILGLSWGWNPNEHQSVLIFFIIFWFILGAGCFLHDYWIHLDQKKKDD
jgi:hypothetical protein